MKPGSRDRLLILIVLVGTSIAAVIAIFPDQTPSQLQLIEDKTPDLSPVAIQMITQCETQIECVMEQLDDLTEQEEKTTVMVTLNDLITIYRGLPAACHPQAHELGLWVFRYLGDVKEAYSFVGELCGGGVRHGVVQSYFKEQVNNGANPNDIDLLNICSETTDNPFALERWHCIHGIGHGLSESYDYDVFSAVNRCEEFEPGWEQISCSKGVFMENQVYDARTSSGDFKENDLYYPCNVVNSKFTSVCYHLQSPYLSLQHGYAFKQSFQACDEISPEEFIKYCYHGMGRSFVSIILKDMSHSPGVCLNGDDSRYYGDCFRGMLMTLVNEKGIDQAFEYCKLIPEEFKQDCYDGMGKWILMLHATDQGRQTDCSRAENSKYVDVCMNASLENIIMF